MSELINNREKRVQTLKEIILHLHRGEAPAAVRGRLAALIADVDASEVAAMEQELMAEGMSHQEVQSLCDLHADVLQDVMTRPATPMPLAPGHPVHQLRAENRALGAAAQTARQRVRELAALADEGRFDAERVEALRAFEVLWEVDRHYQRKEHLVFSVLERHGTTGPSKVMWGKDDEVRDLLKASLAALGEEGVSGAELKVVAETVLEPALSALEGMIYKEENILLPMTLGLFTAEDWGEIFRQSPEYGWCLVQPGTGYRPPEPRPVTDAVKLPPAQAVQFPSGTLSFEQLLGLFQALPVDLTFVDRDDRVAFFSEGPDRVFARSRAVIGREVKHCHPPKSVHVVERIVEDFKAGRQSVAEFWIDLHGRFVHIRYFAVRDAAGAYLGTLEVTQDLTRLRALEGERRLLAYDAGPAHDPITR
ncbi:DUF438 domain-containing protein [Anaeromyxobacter dehalogenans]|uniref:PAS/PAC sensor protein n=1 Tax=Anaeromyxobacter dehalogenans (strain 2CP-C) TaxID=290397 RepID=Q2IEF0_ANADE|nr:DUF438 domain-containing protein [Anaeromyxobacter dehalogenans]ABC82959.1 protein of unknown function DUF438 [Anaeromyxobacter dehalogenans 2CP-C]